MSDDLISKLSGITVARGATPAEEATAKAMLARLQGRQAQHRAETLYERQKAMARGLATMFGSAPVVSPGHTWGERIPMPLPHKWCQQCSKCGTFRITGRVPPDGEWVHVFHNANGDEIPITIATKCQ